MEDVFIPIRYHVWWPGSNDPFWLYNQGDIQTRNSYYSNNYAPHCFFDGVIDGGYSYNSWPGIVDTRSLVNSVLDMDIYGYFDDSTGTGEFTVYIYAEETPALSDLRLRIALIESNISYGGETWNQIFRDMIPSTYGQAITISQGDTLEFTYDLTVLSPLVPENCQLVAFVQSEQNREILQATKEWVNELSSTVLTPFSLISPPDSAILNDTIQTLIWHSSEYMDSVFYKILWDTSPDFNSPDSSLGLIDTTYTVPEGFLRSQRYFWKVFAYYDTVNGRWSENTYTFYVDGYPTLPVPISPENGSQADSSTHLVWLIGIDPDSMDTVTYTLQVDDDVLFRSPGIDVSGIDSSGLINHDTMAVLLGNLPGYDNLQIDQTYYWRVRSDDLFGLNSGFTDGSNYFIIGVNYNDPPNPPIEGFSPSNSEVITSLNPTIIWTAATDPDPDDYAENLAYEFYLFEDTSTGGQEYRDTTDQGINQVLVGDTLHDEAHFYYQVRTIDDEGLMSGWSELQDFWTNSVNNPPEPFPLYIPGPGHIRVVMNTDFVWGNTADLDPMSSFDFTFQVSPDSQFQWYVASFPDLSDTAITFVTDTLAMAGQDLYWRILAIDDDSLTRIGGIPEEVRYLRILPPGDANSSGQTNGLDVTFLVNYLKGIGPTPDPLLAGDANGDCLTNGLDVIYLVAYFKGGPAPVRPDCGQVIVRNLESDIQN